MRPREPFLTVLDTYDSLLTQLRLQFEAEAPSTTEAIFWRGEVEGSYDYDDGPTLCRSRKKQGNVRLKAWSLDSYHHGQRNSPAGNKVDRCHCFYGCGGFTVKFYTVTETHGNAFLDLAV
jgi:hypothetical protein